MQDKMFEKMLDCDEQIVKILHPNKPRYYFNFFVKTALWTLWVFAITVLVMLCFGIAGGYYFLPFAYFGISMAWAVPTSMLKYRKTAYALTNKRVLVCTGVCGVTYTNIEYASISNIQFRQSWLDKILCNTASIYLSNAQIFGGVVISNTVQLCFIENAAEEYTFLRSFIQKNPQEEKIEQT